MAIPTPNLCDSLSLCLYLISVPCLFCCHQQIVLFSTSVSETHSHFSAWEELAWFTGIYNSDSLTSSPFFSMPTHSCPSCAGLAEHLCTQRQCTEEINEKGRVLLSSSLWAEWEVPSVFGLIFSYFFLIFFLNHLSENRRIHCCWRFNADKTSRIHLIWVVS